MKKIKGVIFDLDGTLINTIDDITDSLNAVLVKYGYKTYTPDECKMMICDGPRVLVQRALPKDADDTLTDKLLAEYKQYYYDHACIKTKPYDGIVELLLDLEKLGVQTAIVTNKPQPTMEFLIDKLFKNINFVSLAGFSDAVPHKPDPYQTNQVILKMGVCRDEVLFAGDSAVDMNTAKNAHVAGVGVTWGFRPKEELDKSGAKYIIDYPHQLLDII